MAGFLISQQSWGKSVVTGSGLKCDMVRGDMPGCFLNVIHGSRYSSQISLATTYSLFLCLFCFLLFCFFQKGSSALKLLPTSRRLARGLPHHGADREMTWPHVWGSKCHPTSLIIVTHQNMMTGEHSANVSHPWRNEWPALHRTISSSVLTPSSHRHRSFHCLFCLSL